MNPLHPFEEHDIPSDDHIAIQLNHTSTNKKTENGSSSNSDKVLSSINKDDSSRKSFINQIDIPWERVESKLDPVFMQCDGKIVKYDSKGLAIWRVRRNP
jgi:hypothetical protein